MPRIARVKVPRARTRSSKAAADLAPAASSDRVDQPDGNDGLPESPCGKAEPHAPHSYTYTTGFYLTGFQCPGVEEQPVVAPDYVTQQQLTKVHDAWWDFWISDSDWHRTVHQFLAAVLVVQALAIGWLTVQVLGG